MHNWNDHYDHGFRGGHILMMLTMVILVALVVWAILSRNRRGSSQVAANPSAQSAQSILNERLEKAKSARTNLRAEAKPSKPFTPNSRSGFIARCLCGILQRSRWRVHVPFQTCL